MDDLIPWLQACYDREERRLDEDERVALAATTGPWWHNSGAAWLDPEAFEAYDLTRGEEFVGYGESPFSGCIAATGPGSHPQSMADAEHIARWDPARVLAEVERRRRDIATKRSILKRWSDLRSEVLQALDRDEPDAPPDVIEIVYEQVVRLLAQEFAGEPGREERADHVDVA